MRRSTRRNRSLARRSERQEAHGLQRHFREDRDLLGATPVTMRPDEVYQAVSRGVADGGLMPFNGMETFKIHEVAKLHLDVALGGDTSICS